MITFFSLPDSKLHSIGSNTANDYEISSTPPKKKICEDKISITDSFKVPPNAVHEVGVYTTNLKNEKSMGPDHINSVLLKFAFPYAIESFTFIHNSCMQQSISHCS